MNLRFDMKIKNENFLMIAFAILGAMGIISLGFGLFYIMTRETYFDIVEKMTQEQFPGVLA